MSGIYIHIPFCKQACSYCDFYFVTKSDQKQAFVTQLCNEIASHKDSKFTQDTIKTIYFGGGTPSLLTGVQIEQILVTIYNTFDTDIRELTIELNPDDVTASYLADLKSVGVQRVSMGVQTFDEKLLRFMNRAHSSEEALTCLELLEKSKIDVFTADLIYGNPGQTLEMLANDLETLLQFNPPHVSAYSLTIEPRTRLGKQLELGRLIETDDDIVATHFELVEKKLAEKGIQRYEVSNFALTGAEAIHNSNYWEHKNYIGFGSGAHSFWWNKDGNYAERWANMADLKSYLQKDEFHELESEKLELHDLAEERIMLALRTKKGISISELKKRYHYSLNQKQQSYLQQKREEQLVCEGEHIRLTSNGLKIADAITLDIISANPIKI